MQTSLNPALPCACKDPAAAAGTGTSSTGAATGVGSSVFGSARQSILRVVTAQVLDALGQAGGAHRSQRHRDGNDGAHPQGLAGAVARALKSSAEQGGDPQALLGKVQSGLDAAQSELVERGFDPGQVAAVAAQFTSRVAGLLEGPAPDAGPPTEALAASVQIARKERGALTLTTQDGDVLKIRFRSSERQSLDLASVSTGTGQATTVQLWSRDRTRTRVEVEGTLDAGELKAIEDFVAKVDALANEFFQGDVESAFAAATALDYDVSEIAGFALKLSVSERVQASAVQRSTAVAPAIVPQAAAPDASQGVEPVAGEVAPSAAATAALTLPAPSGESAAPTPTSVVDPLRAVQDFVRKALQTADTPLSVSGYKLAWSAKLQLVAEAVAVATPAGTQSQGGSLLADVLDQAANAAGAGVPQVKLAEAA